MDKSLTDTHFGTSSQFDFRALTAKTATLEKEIIDLKAEKAALQSVLAEQEQLIVLLKETLSVQTKARFGASSEKHAFQENQLQLFNEAELLADVNIQKPVAKDTAELDTPTKAARKCRLDMSKLPKTDVHYELLGDQCTCPRCGTSLSEMTTKTHEELVYVPAHLKVKEHITHVYVCPNCKDDDEGSVIISAPTPAHLIKGSHCSASLITDIIIEKFDKAVPLYRQERTRAEQGLEISRQDMSNWMIKASEWAYPIYELLHQEVVNSDVIHADETTLTVIKNDGTDDRKKTYMWLYMTGACAQKQAVVYEWQPSRSSQHPKEFLQGFEGYCMVDGYQGYRKIDGLIPVGCFAHARRKYDAAFNAIDQSKRAGSLAEHGLELINQLFYLETRYSDTDYAKRYAARLEHSLPIAEELIKWARSVKALPKSKIGEAITYTIEQWDDLMHVFKDGRLELSNNRAERAIKPFVIGRKNWLFSNTKLGACSSAVLYSLVESAKANNLDVRKYLEYIFEALPNITTSRLPELLPWSEAVASFARQQSD